MAKKKPADKDAKIECGICKQEVEYDDFFPVKRNKYQAVVDERRVSPFIRLCDLCFKENMDWEATLRMRRTGK